VFGSRIVNVEYNTRNSRGFIAKTWDKKIAIAGLTGNLE
jgi:hypothetical protein